MDHDKKITNNKVDELKSIWLRRWFLVQTHDEDEADLLQDIRDIRTLLENDKDRRSRNSES